MSSTFILKNPHQLPKTLKSPADKPPTTYQIIESDDPNGDDTKALVEAFKSLLAMGATFEHKIYLIGRYNFDLKRITTLPNQLEVDYRAERVTYQLSEEDSPKQQLEAEFITAHKSKGLEADYIILINCNSGKYGFPSGQADDPILSLLLSSADQFADGEERRLFYVAMTRAKKAVIFLTNKYRKSKFIRELQQAVDDSTHSPRCPKCGDGELVKRHGPHGEFYGCTNWEFGCDYTTNHLPRSE